MRGVIPIQFPLVDFAVSEKKKHAVRQRVICRRWFHADKPARIAQASSPERLVCRSGVIVKCEFRFTRHPIDANRPARQLFSYLAFAHVGAFEFVFVINLKMENVDNCDMLRLI